MKLVQLLAKELKEWPDNNLAELAALFVAQDDDGMIVTLDPEEKPDVDQFNGCSWSRHSWTGGDLIFEVAEDHATSIITRDQWQAEREKMNKPKWIRHRGGLNPINDDVLVEVKLRSGDIQSAYASDFIWRHVDCDYSVNIMQYRIMEETECQEIEEVEAIDTVKAHTIEYAFGDKDSDPKDLDWKQLGTLTYKFEIDATEATQQIDSLVAKWGQIESPLKWRDEIIELEAYEEEFRREREKLIRKLESEGFKLIDHMAPVYGEQIIDLSDWRNWQAGDIVECITDSDNGQFTIGFWYEIKSVNRSSVQIVEDDRGSNTNGWDASNFKFIRRP